MFELIYKTSLHYCDCCGHYCDSYATVSKNNKVLHKYHHDDHFGKDNWNGDLDLVYSFILKEAGYKIVFSNHCDLVESYYGEENLTPIHVEVITVKDSYKDSLGQSHSYHRIQHFEVIKDNDKIVVNAQEAETLLLKLLEIFTYVNIIKEEEDFSQDTYDD